MGTCRVARRSRIDSTHALSGGLPIRSKASDVTVSGPSGVAIVPHRTVGGGAFAGLYATVGGAFQGSATTYAAPAGVHDSLVKNADGTWGLTRKDGTWGLTRKDGTWGLTRKDGTWGLTRKDGTPYSFNAAGFLKMEVDVRDGGKGANHHSDAWRGTDGALVHFYLRE